MAYNEERCLLAFKTESRNGKYKVYERDMKAQSDILLD